MQLQLIELPGEYAVSRRPAGSAVPDWAAGEGLVSVTQAPDETSVLCLAARVPRGVESSPGWCAWQVSNLCDLDEPGVVLEAVRPVADAGLGVFAASTFLRDYLLVRQETLTAARAAWLSAGHAVRPGIAPSLTLRLAAAADAEAVAAFHDRLWRSTYSGLATAEAVAALDLGRRRAQWSARLADHALPSAVLLAEAGGGLAGICAVSRTGLDRFAGALEVDHLYVDPDFRGTGTGRMLLEWALAHAALHGFRETVLAAVQQNRPAIAFYGACGGESAGEQLDKGPLWRSQNVLFRWHCGSG